MRVPVVTHITKKRNKHLSVCSGTFATLSKPSEAYSIFIRIRAYSVGLSMVLEDYPMLRYSLSFLHCLKSSSCSPVRPSFSWPLAIRHFTACVVVPYPEVTHLEFHASLSRLASFLVSLIFSLFISPLPFSSEHSSIVWLCRSLLICSRTDRCFDYWQVWVITSKAVINIHVQVFMWMCFRPFEEMPSS